MKSKLEDNAEVITVGLCKIKKKFNLENYTTGFIYITVRTLTLYVHVQNILRNGKNKKGENSDSQNLTDCV